MIMKRCLGILTELTEEFGLQLKVIFMPLEFLAPFQFCALLPSEVLL